MTFKLNNACHCYAFIWTGVSFYKPHWAKLIPSCFIKAAHSFEGATVHLQQWHITQTSDTHAQKWLNRHLYDILPSAQGCCCMQITLYTFSLGQEECGGGGRSWPSTQKTISQNAGIWSWFWQMKHATWESTYLMSPSSPRPQGTPPLTRVCCSSLWYVHNPSCMNWYCALKTHSIISFQMRRYTRWSARRWNLSFPFQKR